MELETERLLIKDFSLEDVDELHRLVAEPSIYKFMSWGPNTFEDSKNFVEACVAQQNQSPRVNYEMKVIDKNSGDYVGAVGIREQSRTFKKADMGYWIKQDRRGEGLATEASLKIIEFGFEKLGFNKIWATAHPDNEGSLRVLQKVGMQKEGYLREDQYVRGEFRDSVLMAILKNDFKPLSKK